MSICIWYPSEYITEQSHLYLVDLKSHTSTFNEVITKSSVITPFRCLQGIFSYAFLTHPQRPEYILLCRCQSISEWIFIILIPCYNHPIQFLMAAGTVYFFFSFSRNGSNDLNNSFRTISATNAISCSFFICAWWHIHERHWRLNGIYFDPVCGIPPSRWHGRLHPR